MVADRENIPTAAQRFMSDKQGGQLDDERAVADCHLLNGSIITLILREPDEHTAMTAQVR